MITDDLIFQEFEECKELTLIFSPVNKLNVLVNKNGFFIGKYEESLLEDWASASYVNTYEINNYKSFIIGKICATGKIMFMKYNIAKTSTELFYYNKKFSVDYYDGKVINKYRNKLFISNEKTRRINDLDTFIGKLLSLKSSNEFYDSLEPSNCFFKRGIYKRYKKLEVNIPEFTSYINITLKDDYIEESKQKMLVKEK